MTLTWIVVLTGWVTGSLALGTLSERSITWRAISIGLLAAFFAVELSFVQWHFHGLPKSADKEQSELPSDVKPPTPPQPKEPIVKPAPQETIVSKYNRLIFVCDKIKKVGEFDDWVEYSSVVLTAQGYTATYSSLENGGLRIEVTISSLLVTKVTTEIRRLKDQLYVTRIFESASYLQMLSERYVTDPHEQAVEDHRASVERQIGADPGKCNLI